MDDDGNFLDAEGNIIDQSQDNWKDKRSFKQVEISALADLLYNSNSYYSSVINTIGSESANKILKANGLDPTDSFRRYTNDQSLANMKTEISASGSITSDNAAFQSTGKKDHDGNEIKFTVVGNKVVGRTNLIISHHLTYMQTHKYYITHRTGSHRIPRIKDIIMSEGYVNTSFT